MTEAEAREVDALRRRAHLAETELERVVRLGGWRLFFASILDEMRIRLLRGRVGNY